MNQTQLDRWNQASLGLSNSYRLSKAKRAELREEIANCIDYVVCNGMEFINDWDRAHYVDGKLHEYSAGTRVDDYLWNNRHEWEKETRYGVEMKRSPLGDKLSCCVRAGFDMAVAPSAGVLGYTVGDLHKAFGKILPDWVRDFFDPALPLDAAPTEGVWL